MAHYIVKHFDKAATIDHMKHVVQEYPVEVIGVPGVATLEIVTDEKTAERFAKNHPHWDIDLKV